METNPNLADDIQNKTNFFVDTHSVFLKEFLEKNFDFDLSVQVIPYTPSTRIVPAFPSKLFAYLYFNCLVMNDRSTSPPTSLVSRSLKIAYPTMQTRLTGADRVVCILGLRPKPDSEFVNTELAAIFEGEQNEEKYKLGRIVTEWRKREHLVDRMRELRTNNQ